MASTFSDTFSASKDELMRRAEDSLAANVGDSGLTTR